MNKSKEEGFTLIEILIGLNLAFIAFTLIISFYLLTKKFVSSASASVEEKEVLFSSIEKFRQMIRKNQCFTIRQDMEGSLYFLFPSQEDTVSIKKSLLKISDIKAIDNIDGFEMRLRLNDGKEVIVNNTTMPDELLINEGYSSRSVNYISLKISRKSDTYGFEITMPKSSENLFKDI